MVDVSLGKWFWVIWFFSFILVRNLRASNEFFWRVVGGNEVVIIFELTRCGENYTRLLFNIQICTTPCLPCTNHRHQFFFSKASKFLSHATLPRTYTYHMHTRNKLITFRLCTFDLFWCPAPIIYNFWKYSATARIFCAYSIQCLLTIVSRTIRFENDHRREHLYFQINVIRH